MSERRCCCQVPHDAIGNRRWVVRDLSRTQCRKNAHCIDYSDYIRPLHHTYAWTEQCRRARQLLFILHHRAPIFERPAHLTFSRPAITRYYVRKGPEGIPAQPVGAQYELSDNAANAAAAAAATPAAGVIARSTLHVVACSFEV